MYNQFLTQHRVGFAQSWLQQHRAVGLFVTDYAFEAFKFILYKGYCSFRNFLVAGFTSYFNVFAFELEFRFIVVEFFNGPILISVTGGTIRHTKFFKLPVVAVFVTTGASGG